MTTAVQQIRHDLARMGEQFQTVLPSHITPERFQRVAVTALQGDPGLLQCSRESILGACMAAAQDGLLPDKREGAIVKYGSKAQWMPMVAGILKKVRQSGELESLHAEVVRHMDEFDYWVDEDGAHVRHRPDLLRDTESRGPVIAAYAVAKARNGGVYVQVMRQDEIEKVRSVSKAGRSGPWQDWWEEMAIKTVIRRLSKRLPMSTDLEQVITRDDEQYELRDMGQAEQVRRGIHALHEATTAAADGAQGSDADPDGPIPGLDDLDPHGDEAAAG